MDSTVLDLGNKLLIFIEYEDGMIIDMIINRVQDSKCTEKLMELEDEELTINNVMRICRQVELTQAYVKALECRNQGETEVHQARNKVSFGNYSRFRGRGQIFTQGQRQHHQVSRCDKCCRHHQGACRADSEFCGACGRQGHFKRSPLCQAQTGNRFDRCNGSSRSYSGGHNANRGFSRGFNQTTTRGHSSSRPRGGHRRNSRGGDVHLANAQDDVYCNSVYDVDDAANDMSDAMYVGVDAMSQRVEGHVDEMSRCVNVHVAQNDVDVDDFYAILYVEGKSFDVELDTGRVAIS